MGPVLGLLSTETTPAFNKALYKFAMLVGGADDTGAGTLEEAADINAVISTDLGGSDWYGYVDAG